VARDAGIKLAILTAKHHDGFCLWPSQYTTHSVQYSPYQEGRGDVVRAFVEACRAFDIQVGLYLSPWDRHEATYGTDAYNVYFKRQLTELLTQYGPIAEVWFDGACGEGPNGKRQVYDWEGYYRVIRRLQPDAVIAISGPDVRWVGNEQGIARENEWSVVPISSRDPDAIAADSQQHALIRPEIDARSQDLGSRDQLYEAERLVWYPAECDVSIRPGWFYHAREDAQVKSPQTLVDVYFKSVGRNAALLLNLPPDRRGLVHEHDARSLRGMRRTLNTIFSHNLAAGAEVTASHTKPGFGAENTLEDADAGTSGRKRSGYWTPEDWQETAVLEYDLGTPQTFNVILLQEHIEVGQRIERFVIEAQTPEGWQRVAQGGTVGYKRLLRCPNTTTRRVRVRIERARFAPTLCYFGLFMDPG
jgi:alpha-L-fucosidase